MGYAGIVGLFWNCIALILRNAHICSLLILKVCHLRLHVRKYPLSKTHNTVALPSIVAGGVEGLLAMTTLEFHWSPLNPKTLRELLSMDGSIRPEHFKSSSEYWVCCSGLSVSQALNAKPSWKCLRSRFPSTTAER